MGEVNKPCLHSSLLYCYYSRTSGSRNGRGVQRDQEYTIHKDRVELPQTVDLLTKMKMGVVPAAFKPR